MRQFVFPNNQFVDNTGAPGIGWELYIYDTGTTTLASIYSDKALTIPAANPVVSDADGFFQTFFWSGTIDVVLKDDAGNTMSSVTGIIDFQSDVIAIATSLSSAVPFGDATGSGDAIACTIAEMGTSDFADGALFIMRANAVNTGAANTPNLVVNSLASRRIKKLGGSALIASDIISGLYCLLTYNLAQNCYYLLNHEATKLSRDGSLAMLGNLSMGGFKITNGLAGTAATDYPTIGQVQDGGFSYIAAGGTANAITATIAPAVTAYTAGQVFRVKAASTSTAAAVTLNVNGLGIKTVLRSDGSPLMIGDIRSGAICSFMYDGTNFQLLVPAAGLFNHGQCQLSISGGNLLLSPYNGNQMVIDGVVYAIPSAGVTLSPSGAGTNTTLYVYAYISAGTMTLEYSATVPVVSTSTGISIKNGDSSRSLVGMARTDGIPAWTLVRSWFNDPGVVVSGAFSASRTITSPTAAFTEFNSEIRCNFLCWAGETVRVAGTGGALVDLGGADDGYGFIAVAFDGVTAEDGSSIIGAPAVGAQAAEDWLTIAPAINKTGLSEGYHYATLVGFLTVTAGAGIDLVCRGSATTGARTALTVFTKR